MEKKMKFADLFEVDNLKNVKIDKEQLKSISGGNRETDEEFRPVIDIDLTLKNFYTLNREP